MSTATKSWAQDQSQGGAADCAEAWTASAFLYAQNAQVQLLQGGIGKAADNLLSRRFKTSIPHQKITTDTSEFKYWGQDNGKPVVHKLYLDPYMDLFNSEIVSFHIGQTPSAAGIQSALEEAIRVTADCPYRRTFHSDQGWAYQMKSYTKRLKEERIFQSMSRKGNCLDNSVMENFFGLLKQEIYYGRVCLP